MALHRLQQMSIGAPDPDRLDAFYREIGLVGGDRRWGTGDRSEQIRIAEAPYRQLRSLRILCEDEADLAAAAGRLDDIGASYRLADGRLTVTDPVNKWTYIVEPGEVADVVEQPRRVMNFPGERNRLGARAEVLGEQAPRVPRRLGHVVVGSTDPRKSVELCMAIGFRVSDIVAGGLATFMRCSHDHHNLLITPGEVPYLNHYALEHDDFDSVFLAATIYLKNNGQDTQIAGPGRHYIEGALGCGRRPSDVLRATTLLCGAFPCQCHRGLDGFQPRGGGRCGGEQARRAGFPGSVRRRSLPVLRGGVRAFGAVP